MTQCISLKAVEADRYVDFKESHGLGQNHFWVHESLLKMFLLQSPLFCSYKVTCVSGNSCSWYCLYWGRKRKCSADKLLPVQMYLLQLPAANKGSRWMDGIQANERSCVSAGEGHHWMSLYCSATKDGKCFLDHQSSLYRDGQREPLGLSAVAHLWAKVCCAEKDGGW